MTTSRIDRWLAPISDESPTGNDPVGSPGHSALRSQLNDLGTIDWKAFTRDAESLLVGEAKDLVVACYVACGLMHTEGLGGLAEGMDLVSNMANRFGDACFPASKGGRIRGIDWLLDQVGRDLARRRTGTAEAIARLRGALPALCEMAKTRLGNDALAEKASALLGRLDSLEVNEGDSTNEAQERIKNDSEDVPPESSGAEEAAEGLASPMARFNALKAEFAKPVSDESPEGENLMGSAAFAAIKEESENWNRAGRSASVDWESIRDQSKALLTTKSKDFRLAYYFGVAAYRLDGIHGLVQGVAALTALLERHWEGGHPQRERVRRGFLALFQDRVEDVGQIGPTVEQAEDVELLCEGVRQLNEQWEARLNHHADKLGRAAERLQMTIEALRDAGPTEEEKEENGDDHDGGEEGGGFEGPIDQRSPSGDDGNEAGGSQVGVQLPPAPAAIANLTDVDEFVRQVGTSITDAAKAIRRASPESPLAYRLSRVGLYLHMNEAPVPSVGKKTSVPAPPEQVAAQLEQLHASKNWTHLLEASDDRLATARMWLDLHRYCYVALEGLGHHQASATVLNETAALVARLKGLLDLSFDDGRPFASPATRTWLAKASGSRGPATAPVTDFEQHLHEGEALAARGDLQKALEALKKLADAADATGRDEFRAKLAMAGACSAAGEPHAANGILAGLAPQIDRFDLEHWEPELAIACYRSRYETLLAISAAGTNVSAELSAVFQQLCRVDLTTALNLGSPPV